MCYKCRIREFYKDADPIKYEEMEIENHKRACNMTHDIIRGLNKFLIISLFIGACYYFISQ